MPRTETTNTYFLFTNQSVDANSTAVIVNYPNKSAIIKVTGAFDGAELTFQSLAPQRSPAVWLPIPERRGLELSMTDVGQRPLTDFVYNEQIRAVLTGTGVNTDLTVSMEII